MTQNNHRSKRTLLVLLPLLLLAVAGCSDSKTSSSATAPNSVAPGSTAVANSSVKPALPSRSMEEQHKDKAGTL